VTGWLLDTNVLSELRRASPNRNVVRFIESRPIEDFYVSEITFAEIRYGIERQPDHGKRAELIDWVTKALRPMFAHRTLPLSEDVILKWRLLVDEGKKVGHTLAQPDLFLAATALCHGLTLVTRNVSDFEPIKIDLINPWE
jgi:toxin FitB